ncbi:MAG: hypothetical protein M1608_13060, partial [Candidatus Omnitrophica bacterium]|nr:hypothetical protein [Candidatus Omnitrophota bacterium]
MNNLVLSKTIQFNLIINPADRNYGPDGSVTNPMICSVLIQENEHENQKQPPHFGVHLDRKS